MSIDTKQLRFIGLGVLPPLQVEMISQAADEIDHLNRLCKKQEATIQRHEDALVNGNGDE